MLHAKRALLVLLAISLLLPCVSCGSGDGASSAEASAEVSEISEVTSEEVSEAVKDPNFIIAKDGEVCVQILIANNASTKEYNAAKDLAHYINKMVGQKPEVIRERKAEEGKKYILVGESDHTKALGFVKPTGYPGDEEVIVRQTGDYLVFMGNDDGNFNGTQFAVNMYLESLGCGWYGVDELWQVIPTLTDINATGVDIHHIPRFSSRITRVQDTAVADKWYIGGEKSLTGHWLFQIAPASMYKDHPEWYALTNGSRDPSGYDYFQFCYSNDEFADYVASKLEDYFKANPLIISMTIAANDGWDEHFCECDKCKALGNTSDCMVNFANKVAKKVAVNYPDRSLQIYSYHMTYNPPVNSVPLEPNVELMLCREASLTRPLDTDYFKEGKDPITRNTYTRSWRENALEWIEKTSCKNVSVWCWYCIAADKKEWQFIPWVQGDVATRDIEVWESLGVKYVFYDQGPLAGYNEDESSFSLRWPLWYVSSKAMWTDEMTGEEILKDACSKLYGPAADAMFDYYKALADCSENCTAYSMTWVPPTVKEVYFKNKKDLQAKIDAVKDVLSECNDTEKERIRNQLEYWNKLYDVIKR